MEIFTLGFTQKTAVQFFGILKEAGISRLLDIRLNNVSQLAGFTKRDDLAFFLREVLGAAYTHETLLAPTQPMLDAYKKSKGSWETYEHAYLDLLAMRQVAQKLDRQLLAVPTVLLCSEPKPEHCHRRLAAEYLQRGWGDIKITHL